MKSQLERVGELLAVIISTAAELKAVISSAADEAKVSVPDRWDKLLPQERSANILPMKDRAPMPASPKKADETPYTSIVDNYHRLCLSLPRVMKYTPGRARAVRARWEEAGKPLDALASFFAAVGESDFLAGRSTSWRASFDWLMLPANFVKVREGNYTNRRPAPNDKRGTLSDDDHARPSY